MESGIIISIISGTFAITTAIIACCQQYKINKDSIRNHKRTERNERKLENFKLLQKFKDPLLQASRELYFFIVNIFKIKQSLLDNDIQKKTLIYSFAKFFCWKEIIRDNLIIMDDIESNHFFNLRNNLMNVQKQFNNLHICDSKFKLSSSEQKAIGEIMIENNSCIKYTDFILNYNKYKHWFLVLEKDIDEMSKNIYNFKPCIPDKKKPLMYYNNLERFCQNLFDPHEWVSINYFNEPKNNKCIRCDEKLGNFFHKSDNISIEYFRLLNIKNALNNLICSNDNNKEYYLDIEPIWSYKLENKIKIESEKDFYKKKYGCIWKMFYIFKYKLYNNSLDENNNNISTNTNNLFPNNLETNSSETNNLETNSSETNRSETNRSETNRSKISINNICN